MGKIACLTKMNELGYPILDYLLIDQIDIKSKSILKWLSNRGDNLSKRYTVKPVSIKNKHIQKSIIGAESVIEASISLLSRGIDSQVLVEPSIEIERVVAFSIAVVETDNGTVAFMPFENKYHIPNDNLTFADLEVETYSELLSRSKEYKDLKLINSKIRKDHFEHTLHSATTSPSATKIVARPKLPFNIIQRIRKSSEKIFKDLGFRDFAIINGVILGENFDSFLLPCKTKNKKSYEKTELATSSYEHLMLNQFKNSIIQTFEIEELVHQLNIRIGTRDKRFEYLKNYLVSVIEKKKNMDFIFLHEASKISTKPKEFKNYEIHRP